MTFHNVTSVADSKKAASNNRLKNLVVKGNINNPQGSSLTQDSDVGNGSKS